MNLALKNLQKLIWRKTQTKKQIIIPLRWPDLVIIKWKRKRNCHLVDFTALADHKIKIKVSKKTHKYLDLAKELKKKKKLLEMRLQLIPFVLGAFGTVPKRLERGPYSWKPEEESRPFRLQHCWDRSQRLEETCCRSESSERLTANTSEKNS